MQPHIQACILIPVGLLITGGSVAFYLLFSNIFANLLDKKLMLTPGSQTLQNFMSPPVPIYMQFWLFNITNSEEILKGGKPRLRQIGPYTFEETQLKYDLTFNDLEGSVTYLQNKSFFYREDLTPGSLEDEVTAVNAVMMGLGAKLSSYNTAMRGLIELWFTRFSVKPFVRRTVRELLFEGYEEPLLLQLAGLTKNPLHAKGRFGFFYPKNNTNGGTYTVKTGVLGMDDYQHILRWREKERLDFWKGDMWGGDRCNMINGTTGNQFPRPVRKRTPIRLYTAELCRSIYATFQREVYHGPLKLHRYALPPELLANTQENKCYCVDEFTCRASMINVSPCRDGSPVVMSTPHFYQGRREDVEEVTGLEPNPQEHETFLDIEPTTGVTFRAAKRIQVNVAVRRYGDLPAFDLVPELILPVLWVNESVEVPLERTRALHRTLTLPFTLVTTSCAILVLLGTLLVLLGIYKLVLARKNHGKNRKPKNEKENSVKEKLNNRNYS